MSVTLVALVFLFIIFPLWMIAHCATSKNLRPSSKISWCIFILVVPFFGAVIYGIISSKTKFLQGVSGAVLVLVLLAGYRLISFAKKITVANAVRNLDQLTQKQLEPIPINDTDAGNAAVFYYRAQKYLIYPESKEEREKIREASEIGWFGTNNEMIRVLNGNAPCIGEIEKAAKVEKCDFYFGTRQRTKLQNVPKYPPLLYFYRLYLLKARMLENSGKQRDAINCFLVPLKMSLQVAQNEDHLAPIIAVTMAKGTFKSLNDFLGKNRNLPREEVQKLYAEVSNFKQRIISPDKYIGIAKDDFLSIVNLLADAPRDFRWSGGKEPASMTLLRRELKERAAVISGELFASYAKAAISNSDSDWASAAGKLEEFKKQQKPSQAFLDWTLGMDAALRADEEAYTRAYVDKTIKTLLSASVPDLRKALSQFPEMQNDLEVVLVELQARMIAFDNSKLTALLKAPIKKTKTKSARSKKSRKHY